MGNINKALYNFLNDKCEQPRYACYIVEDKLRVYIQGGECVEYDPENNEINLLDHYSAGLNISSLSISNELLRKIYEKLSKKEEEKESPDQILKQKYGLATNKRISAKGREEIHKYEAHMQKGISGGKGSGI